MESMFRCPVCAAPLERRDGTYACPKGHSFDISREGYVHLLPANQKHSKAPGDDKEMAAALRSGGSPAVAAEEIKLRSRQYAKRQLTWFRRNPAAKWLFWEEVPDFARACQASTEYMEEFGIS